MRLKNQYCCISIETDPTYVIGAPQSSRYNKTLNLGNYEAQEFYKVLCVKIDLYVREYTMAIIGDGQSWDEDCAILEGTALTILQGWQILQVNVLTGELIKSAAIDSMGCNLGLYKIHDKYLIHGEIDITMLNSDFQKLWYFSGRDIFVANSKTKAIEIKEDRICLNDFEGNYYELSFEGNEISYHPSSRERKMK